MQNMQFKNQFLIAMPGQVGGDFSRSVTLLADHNDDGAMGLVINKPSDLHFLTHWIVIIYAVFSSSCFIQLL